MTDFTFPLLLALDTSTDHAAIGLTDGEMFTELRWPAGRAQTTSLLPEIDHLLRMVGAKVDDVGAAAVAIGPGTFTGLRVGLSIAKGLSLAKGIPVVSIKTLAIIGYPYESAGVPVLAVLPAGRGRVVWEIREPACESGPVNSSIPELVDRLRDRPDLLVAGELQPAQREMIAAVHDRIEPIGVAGRRASVLAQLGWQRWHAGDVDDVATLEPLYVHGRPASTVEIVDRLKRKSG